MKIVFLGTNGWFDTSTGNTSCVLIDTGDFYVILDAGSGFPKLDQYIQQDKAAFLFLSHFHLDHIVGLHTLVKFSFDKGLHIIGPQGTNDILNILLNQPFSIPLKSLPFTLNISEVPIDDSDFPFDVDCFELEHTPLSIGYRFRMEGKVIAYCPDTGYCENAVRLAERADVLIAECSFKSGESLQNWPHLNPKDASTIAKQAKARQLILTHFDASRYRTLDDRKAAATEAGKTFKNSIASEDGMVIEI